MLDATKSASSILHSFNSELLKNISDSTSILHDSIIAKNLMDSTKSASSILRSFNTSWLESSNILQSSFVKSSYIETLPNLTKTIDTFGNMFRGFDPSLFQTAVKFNDNFIKMSDILSVAISTQMNVLGTLSEIVPQFPKISLQSLTEKQKDKLGNLLDNLNPNLNKKREGAWTALESQNPDKVSQCANSTVELLKYTIESLTSETKWKEGLSKLKVYLADRYDSKKSFPIFIEKTDKWVESTIEFIDAHRTKIEGVKHHHDFEHENVAKGLLMITEGILLILLDF
jgi:hypothetical protein